MMNDEWIDCFHGVYTYNVESKNRDVVGKKRIIYAN